MSDASTQSESNPPDATEVDLETENIISSYEQVAEWIRFADAKVAVVLTVTGALAGTLIPTLKEYLAAPSHPTEYWTTLVSAVFAGWLILALASSVYAFRCILPFRSSKGVHPALEHCPHFHPAAIASKYGSREFDKFIADYREAGIAGFQEQVLAGLLIDSHISAVKYAKVTSSIRLLGYCACLAITYLLLIQF
jgi:hypothetical protein